VISSIRLPPRSIDAVRTPTWRFETGTPGFPPDLLTEREAWLPRPGRPETDAALLSVFGEGNISTEALMFQSGHLRIDEEQQISGTWFYRLRYPDQEVHQRLNTPLLEASTPQPQTNGRTRR
jgi:hypothetical protein